MAEGTLVGYVTTGLRRHCAPCSVTKHSDAFTPGIADLSYRVNGVNGWCELKEAKKVPVRPTTPVKFGSEFTTAQALFLCERDGKLLMRITPLRLYLGMNCQWAWQMQRAGGWPLARIKEHAFVWERQIAWEDFAEWLSTKTI